MTMNEKIVWNRIRKSLGTKIRFTVAVPEGWVGFIVEVCIEGRTSFFAHVSRRQAKTSHGQLLTKKVIEESIKSAKVAEDIVKAMDETEENIRAGSYYEDNPRGGVYSD